MLLGPRDLARETMREFLIDLEAALPYRWSQRRAKIARLRAEAIHRAHALLRDACDDAAPSGVDRTDDLASRIHHQDRYTVRARDGKEDFLFRSDHSVTVRLLRDVRARDNPNVLAVHLMASRDRRIDDNLAQTAPVLIDVRAIVTNPV